MLLEYVDPRRVDTPDDYDFVVRVQSLQLLGQHRTPHEAMTKLCKRDIQVCMMAPTQPDWWRPQCWHNPVLLQTIPFTLPLGIANIFVDLLVQVREYKEVGIVTYQLTIHADDSFMDEHSHGLFGTDFRECPQRLVAQDNTKLINKFLALYLRAGSQRCRPEADIQKELQQAQSLFLILEASLKVMWQDEPSTAWESEMEQTRDADGNDDSDFPVNWGPPLTAGYLEVGKPIPVRDDIATPEALDHLLRFAEDYTSHGTNTDDDGNEYTVPRMPRLKPLILFRHSQDPEPIAQRRREPTQTVSFTDIWYLFKPGDEVMNQSRRQAYRVVDVASVGHKVISPWRNYYDKSEAKSDETPGYSKRTMQ
ncbi:hypothetical protein B0T25DRAFT_562772 [Lasiosphaeria hispida]|uniref:Uncharacterized protein n=1 Tax=Lasiosphaeria hispida TaxID=260671 RepID=A0AAJ0HWA6_9PEZI|nr:hypothetical protein B0T25DRAFT_562772 [Lasiosphaeria hispida]